MRLSIVVMGNLLIDPVSHKVGLYLIIEIDANSVSSGMGAQVTFLLRFGWKVCSDSPG